MRTGIIVELSASDREHLAAIVADRNSPQKHVWRAHIVLLTADGSGTAEIMRRTGTSKTAVWRWQERFMAAGVAGLLRDKTHHRAFRHLALRSCPGLSLGAASTLDVSLHPNFRVMAHPETPEGTGRRGDARPIRRSC